MATSISRTWYNTLVDDSGGGTDGTILDKADFDAILDDIDALFSGGITNSFMTLGLQLAQGSADDEILAFNSTDVAHGITDETITSNYGTIKKFGGTQGGLRICGLTESEVALMLRGMQTIVDTGKTTSANAAVQIGASLKSGTGPADVSANGNLLAILNNSTTRFLFDVEGSAHADVEWTTFDTHDDIALLETLDVAMSARDAVTNRFGDVLRYNAAALTEAGIVNFYDDGPRAMVNFTRLAMLHTGALRQLGRQFARLEQALITHKLLPEGI